MGANQIALISFVGITLLMGLVLLALRRVFSPQAEAVGSSSRLATLPRPVSTAELNLVQRFDGWFARTLYLSGVGLNVTTAALLIALCGAALAAAAFVAAENSLLTVLAAITGMAAMLGYFYYLHRKRLREFQQQFPGALDLLARAVRAGESLEQAIELLGDSAVGDPLATEFRRCSRQLEMGLSVPAAMASLHQRVNLMDVKIFSSAIAVHREAGGNLAETLERLASVIRQRMTYHRHLKSVTGAGRISILLISLMGPLLFAYLFIFQPEYGHGLWQDPLGRSLLITAVVLEIVGLFWVSRLLKVDY